MYRSMHAAVSSDKNNHLASECVLTISAVGWIKGGLVLDYAVSRGSHLLLMTRMYMEVHNSIYIKQVSRCSDPIQGVKKSMCC